jgi:alpha-beta hydrolase superfamily lysophospholipase
MTREPARVDFPSSGGVTIAAYRWDPDEPPKAIAQITHGVGEYATRYARVAEALTAAGYVVYAHDHRGHANSAASEADLGLLGENGWSELVADIGRMSQVARTAHPGLPLGLVAHSLGSFATQQYLLDHSADVDAVALSGTAALDLLEPAMDLEAPMDLSGFNAAFQPQRTDFDWLSRDEAEVDAYIAHPWCGFGLDVPGNKGLFAGARAAADPVRLAAIRPDLPLYITVGEKDPVNGGLVLVDTLVDRYRAAGLTDITVRVWPGARHEVFNETNRFEVVVDLVDWLDSRLARVAERA